MDHRYLCAHCTPYRFLNSLNELKQHLNSLHANLSSYTCGQCNRLFLHKTSYIRHLKEQHNRNDQDPEVNNGEQVVDQDGGARGGNQAGGQDAGQNFEMEDYGDVDDGEVQAEDVNEQVFRRFDLQQEASTFLLNLRSSGNLTNVSVGIVIDNVSLLLRNILLQVQEETRNFLTGSGVPAENANEFLAGATFLSSNIFAGLQSIEDELEFYKDRFGLVIPEEKHLSYRIENRFDRKLRMFVPQQVPETFQYVSLIGTLTLVVRNVFLRNLIMSEKPSEDGVYRSYKDGSDFQNNNFLRKYPFTLRLNLYYDGLEIVNALGSKDTIHTLGCFYISIQNFPPEESALLSSIFLLALCNAQDLKKPDAYSKILAKCKAELKQLQSDEGVEIDLPEGGTFILRASLVSLTADTLAAHEFLGLMGPSALRFCRACLISKHEFTIDTTFMGALRTTRLHEEHVTEVEQRPASAGLYGVRQKSALSSLMRVPEDCVFDAFHDLVGVVQMMLKLALYEFILVRKLFSVEDFNRNINMFVYGKPDIKNKPSPNFTRKKLYEAGHTLKQYGSQTFCLLRVFPFLIKGVDETDRYMQLVFLLQDLVQIIFSNEARDTDINRLEALIYQFGSLFHETFISGNAVEDQVEENPDDGNEFHCENDEFECENVLNHEDDDEEADDPDDPPDMNIEGPPRRRRKEWKSKKLKKGINKLHHLFHYAQQMREKGPIIRLWCARCEGRHRIIRKHAGVQSCFKNPPKTMARMFQVSTLAALLSRKGSHKDDVLLSNPAHCSVRESPYRALLLDEGLQETDNIQLVESAKVCGEVFQSGLFVMLKPDVGLAPLFAVIVDVLAVTNSSRVILVVSESRNCSFSNKYNSYYVSNQFKEEQKLIDTSSLANHRPIAPWKALDVSDENLYLYPRTVSV